MIFRNEESFQGSFESLYLQHQWRAGQFLLMRRAAGMNCHSVTWRIGRSGDYPGRDSNLLILFSNKNLYSSSVSVYLDRNSLLYLSSYPDFELAVSLSERLYYLHSTVDIAKGLLNPFCRCEAGRVLYRRIYQQLAIHLWRASASKCLQQNSACMFVQIVWYFCNFRIAVCL